MTENEFLTLCNKVTPKVLRYARSATSSYEDAQDLVQTALLLAWRNINQYDATRSDFSTWFITIYRNVLMEFLRRQYESGYTSTTTISMWDIVEEPQQEVDDLLQVTPHYTNKIALEQALTKLGGIHEQVIRGCFFGGLTFQEISQKTGITQRSIRRILATGLKRMKRILNDEGASDNGSKERSE